MTKEDLIKALNDGRTIANSIWWLKKDLSTGKVYGDCEAECCNWDFDTVEDAVDLCEKPDHWSILC